MKRDGNLCKYYLNLEGCCFLNSSECCNPFSVEGCKIQCQNIFHENTEYKHYESGEDKKITRKEIWKALGIRSGDIVGEWIIPYGDIEPMIVSTDVIIYEAKENVKNKFVEADKTMSYIKVFHNVELFAGECGIYVLGVGRC